MKRSILTLLIPGLLAANAQAQTSAPVSGKITYEGMRQIDFSQMRRVINGQEVRPGDASDAPEGAPEVVNFTQKLVFAGPMAKEERDRPQNMMFRRNMGDGGAAGQNGPGGGGNGSRPWRGGNGQRMTPPFEQTTFLDLANRQRIDVMTVKKDSVTSQTYRTERPLPAVTDWKEDSKTKKIAGYVCHKATATHRKMPYTIWYTTDLPITYSPVADLTPPKGVVLLIESDTESYKATNVSMEAIAEASVQPPKDAKTVTSEEMDQIRRKGMADMRQRMMQNMPMPRN
ncbi:GLPGLI family protein [Spirosoma validum]|uniref:GLPGLI family protein n=1 Tax=Spirosoma validum TaxID=2771355 RepID=A0A927AZV4_9BACT|nr:GLPGLI family protein [Spirosoma validum]MBD2752778.1 GLPGLI family protein [Spirosoma validum]